MAPLHALPLPDLLDRVASPAPTPGGGSVSAIAGAFAAALAQMVAGLPRTRHNTDDERAALQRLQTPLGELRGRLAALADEDAAAFDRLMAAFRLSKTTDEEKTARRAAIQAATRDATSTPMETAEACARVLEALVAVAAHGNPSAASDVAVAVGLAKAAAEGAAANVRVNLDGIADDVFKAATGLRVAAVLSEVERHAADARAALG
jgi:formiminotetrahydrofolate cyclodeaminase